MRRAPLHLVALVACLLPLPGYLLLEPGSTAELVGYVVVVLLAVAFTGAGLRRLPRGARRPWLLVGACQAAFAVGELVWLAMALRGVETYPSAADAVYLTGYALLVAGVLGLVREPASRHRRGALLDAAIVTTSVAALVGVLVVLPAAQDGGSSRAAQLVAALYPLADVALVHLLARTLTWPGGRGGALLPLVLALVCTVCADFGWSAWQAAVDDTTAPRWMNLAWLLYYVLVAVAACSPGAAALASPAPPRRRAGLTRGRLAVLSLAALLPSLLLVGSALLGTEQHVVLLGGATLVVVALVLLRVADLLELLRQQADQLAEQARTDPLTGLANRRTWDHALARACAAAAARGLPLSVALVDLDHFKRFNDTHGHPVGDELLREAAAAWREALGAGVVLARWGGEEFAVLLPGLGAAAATARLDAVHASTPRGQTCSIGVAVLEAGQDPDAVLRRADEALYAAKRAGRARTEVAPAAPPGPGVPRGPAVPVPRLRLRPRAPGR
ncbi:GGDEF domain-containing protein [Kineococcus glutinatus]|uniref:GGDEF domain-containing protein n=1 Tax=Kineococcus glutinatus TaxID=1070872 RepID=A0ABP9HBU2_9ACTN